MKSNAIDTLLEALTVGGRLNPEQSYAKERKYYGNPADSVKFDSEKGGAMNDHELEVYCQRWVQWCFTRGFYLKPGAKNILARMQPSKSGKEPNARNDPDMQYFNMAIHAIADMPEYADGLVCFNLYYVDHADNVKVEAHRLGISRPTYYNRAKAFARKAHSLSISLKTAHELMSNTGEVIVD